MRAKDKAFVYNFFGFALFFLLFRFVLGSFLDLHRIFLAVLAALLATILSPKFGAVRTEKGKKVMMKWIFMKGNKEV